VAARGSIVRSVDLNSTDEQENPLWGAPRIHGETADAFSHRSPPHATVAKYMTKPQGPRPSQWWKTFLRENPAAGIASPLDLFRVRTISFKLLYCPLVMLRPLPRRRLVSISRKRAISDTRVIAGHVTRAFPLGRSAGRHLIRDATEAFGSATPAAFVQCRSAEHPTHRTRPLGSNGHGKSG